MLGGYSTRSKSSSWMLQWSAVTLHARARAKKGGNSCSKNNASEERAREHAGSTKKYSAVSAPCCATPQQHLRSWELPAQLLSYLRHAFEHLKPGLFFCISWVSLIMIDLLTVRIMVENFFFTCTPFTRALSAPLKLLPTSTQQRWLEEKLWHAYIFIVTSLKYFIHLF